MRNKKLRVLTVEVCSFFYQSFAVSSRSEIITTIVK